MQYQKIPLPIDAYLDGILKVVQESSTILIKASPGSGKTTRLPWFIAKETQKKVLVLEPRRLAAKLAAERIAFEENFNIGNQVGYHFRFEKKTTQDTQVIFCTEGTFLKMALSNPKLAETDIVILDEFHERHLETDMALAFLLELQTRRSDLKIILMSATLDLAVTQHLKNPEMITIEAPIFPVDIHYLPNQPSVLNQSLEIKIRDCLIKIPRDHDVLIFLPGMREILKIQSYLSTDYGDVFILHSEVSKEEQQKAIGANSKRKIILSTNIAESSVTIPGVKAVIDSGIQRSSHYSPWNGLKTIDDRPVTKSSAIQRTGRAGRTAPGACYRLYSRQDYESREENTIAEITKADLTDTYYLAKQFESQFKWLTPPPTERWEKAKNLCLLMGLLDEKERPTTLASKLAHYPLDLRLSRILIAGENLIWEEKKKLVRYICQVIENDTSGILERRLSFFVEIPGNLTFSWEKCLIAGFIDQVAKYRPKQNDLIHFSGKGLKLHPSIGSLTEGYYLVLDITQRQEAIKIVAIEEDWLFEHEPFPFTSEDQVIVEPSFSIKSMTKLGSIVIDEKYIPMSWPSLTDGQRKKTLLLGENVFLKSWEKWKETESYHRFHFWHKLNSEATPPDPTLHLYLEHNNELNWSGLEAYFKEYCLENELNRHLPWTINLVGKRELKIHYPFNQDPYIEAPIQDFYGLTETPRVTAKKIPVTLKLIGPHKRPLQVTKDIAGFWTKTYQEMLKEFRREYPRHHWPDDPRKAKPILLKRQLTEN
jgi:ATP-dependent helicase HrpB